MTGDSKNIDKLFRQGLKGFRGNTPVHAWSKLNSALDGAMYRRKMFFYRLIAASVLILMAFGAGYFYAIYLNPPAEVAEKESTINPISSPQLTEQDNGQKTLNQNNPPAIASGTNTEKIEAEESGKTTHVPPVTLATNIADDQSSVIDKEPTFNPNDKISLEESSGIKSVGANNLSSLAFINVSRIHLPDNMVDQSNSLFAENPTSDLFVGYQGMVPYDFDLKPTAKEMKWAMGAQFAPTYSYREISTSYGTSPVGDQENYNDVEDALLSYAGGLNVDYNFSGRWSVQSGVYFSRIGQVNNDALQFEQKNDELLLFAINTSTGNIDMIIEKVPENVRKVTSPKDSIGMGGVEGVKVIQNFDLFEVPLLLKYKVLNRKFSVHFTGGLSPAYLMNNTTYLEMEDHKYDIGGDAGNLNSMIVNTSLGLGLEYLITNTFSVNFEPTFKYSLNPINNNSDFNYHPYYFSWFTGIRLKIN